MENKERAERNRERIREEEAKLEMLETHLRRMNFVVFVRSISEKAFLLLKEEHSRLWQEVEEQKERIAVMKQMAKNNEPIIKTLPESDGKINIIWYFDRQDQLREDLLTLERERAKFSKNDHPQNRTVFLELSRLIGRLEAELDEIAEILDNAFYP